MKSNKLLYALICVASIVIANILYVLFIDDLSVSRIVNIAGVNLALLGVLIGSVCLSKNKENKFLSYTKIPFLYGVLGITLILNNILIIANLKDWKVSLAVQVILFGLLIIILSVNKIADNASEQDTLKIKKEANNLKSLADRLESIMRKVEDNRDIYRTIEKAYDSIRSAKMNVVDVDIIDSKIMSLIEKLESIYSNNNLDEIKKIVEDINDLIYERNKNHKIYSGD